VRRRFRCSRGRSSACSGGLVVTIAAAMQMPSRLERPDSGPAQGSSSAKLGAGRVRTSEPFWFHGGLLAIAADRSQSRFRLWAIQGLAALLDRAGERAILTS